jgi:hypothetical protein
VLGVPEITQLPDKLKPDGRVGVEEQDVALPAEFEGVMVEMAEFFVKVKELVENVRLGAMLRISSERVTVLPFPIALLGVMA